jgi:prophage regulatory protein
MSEAAPQTRILRLPEVRRKVGLGTDSIYRLAREDKFPKPIKLSERASGWVESELDAWLAQRIAARRSDSAPVREQSAA